MIKVATRKSAMGRGETTVKTGPGAVRNRFKVTPAGGECLTQGDRWPLSFGLLPLRCSRQMAITNPEPSNGCCNLSLNDLQGRIDRLPHRRLHRRGDIVGLHPRDIVVDGLLHDLFGDSAGDLAQIGDHRQQRRAGVG
jgi:hypothetical protein